ncbi:MAG: 16S rRNA processing protein RimM [Treponema sp.]|nr:16S rRNA processing protein RimM [Treponema sp.]
MKKEQLVVGFVRGSHGYAGECKIESASGDYEHLVKLKEVTLRHGSLEKLFKVEAVSGGNHVAFMKFAGINSDEEIRKYSGWEIVVPRKYAHPLEENEWYIEDLKNCSLVWNGQVSAASAAPQEIVGTITDVLEGGVGYLLEVSLSESCSCIDNSVKYDSNGKVRKVLVPFVNEHVGKIDVNNQTVQLMHLWILE